jgi:hypothetical protein
VELKGVRGGVERRRGRGLKPGGPGRRDTLGQKVLKERRSPRRRGRTGTSARYTNAPVEDESGPRGERAVGGVRAAVVGVELKGVRSGVERRRGVSGLKAGGGRRETQGKVLKDRRSPRRRGRMGTGVNNRTERA